MEGCTTKKGTSFKGGAHEIQHRLLLVTSLEEKFIPTCEGSWETLVLSNSYPEPKQQDGCFSMTLAWLESRWSEGLTP